jgi:esterase
MVVNDQDAMQSTAEAEHHRLRLELSGLPYRPLAPPRRHHIVLRGMRFHYVEWGDHAGRPILLLHGGGQTCRTWDVVCHELSPHYRCVALDQRGHGDSEWSYESDYRVEAHAADTAALVDALDLAPLVIVGMSLGGIAGLHYALGRPETVAGFVAVDVGPWVDVEAGRPIREFMQEVGGLDQLDQFVDAALRLNPRRDARLLRHSLWNNLRSCPDGRLMWKTDLRRRHERSAAVAAALGAIREHIADLRCPTLIVRGGDSAILSEEHARRFAQAIPRGRWITIAGAGHNVQGDQPKALVEALRGFLDEIGPSSHLWTIRP